MKVSNRILVVSCLLGTFLAGGISGGFVKANWDTRPPKPPQFKAEEMAQKICGHYSSELHLSREQEVAFGKIIREQGVKIEEAHKRLGSEVHGLFHEMDAKLMALLSEEQKEKFLELRRQRNRRMGRPDADKEHKFSGPPPGEPPPGVPPKN